MDTVISVEEYKRLLSQPRASSSKKASVKREGFTIMAEDEEAVEALKTFEVRDDDSWIVTYSKTGTTWVQEIMSCVMHDGDLEAVNKRHTVFRVPYLENSLPKSVREANKLPATHEVVDTLPSPRVIKSHLPGQLLPPQLWDKGKVIYVIRNPKDTVVSYFHFLKYITPGRADQTFSEFFDEVMAGNEPYGPWWDHYLFFWKKRHLPNVLFLRFEDLKRDLRGNVERISKFLGKDLPAQTLDAITDHCTFANMKKNPMTNIDSICVPPKPVEGAAQATFMRKGKVGDWKSHFTVAQNEAMDTLIRDKFHGTGLTFDQ